MNTESSLDSTVRVLWASTAALARTVENPAVTVEAEYGEYVAEGTLYTAAHHQKSGPYVGTHAGGDRRAPCNDLDIPTITEGIILVSHLDLDTVGGVLRANAVRFCNKKRGVGLFGPFMESFWDTAEFVDTNGAHALSEKDAHHDVFKAWWKWLEDNRPRINRDEVVDVTDFFDECYGVLYDLFAPHRYDTFGKEAVFERRDELLAAGKAWWEANKALNQSSFVGAQITANGRVIAVRVANQFVNHIYELPEINLKADCICALDTKTKSIRLSFLDNGKTLNACDTIRRVWGDKDEDGRYLAGGHPGIAGTPRGKRQGLAGLWGLVHTVVQSYEAQEVCEAVPLL
jgi:hypothetical protein